MQGQIQSSIRSMPSAAQEPARLLYSKRDSARMLSISVRKVDYLIADGRLKASRIDGRVLIHRDELARFASKA